MRIPMPCAISWISSQRSCPIFSGYIAFRTRSEKTSAPPPGMVCNPASCSRRSTSSTDVRVRLAKKSISTAVYALICAWGAVARISSRISA